jgi:hypothetical protein
MQFEGVRDPRVMHRSDLLDLEVVVTAAEGSHFIALARLGALGHAGGPGMLHLSALLNALEVLQDAPAALHTPPRPAGQHRFHL